VVTESFMLAGRRQFGLKGLFGTTAALAVLLGLFVSGNRVLVGVGWTLLILFVGGSVGFIINGRKGAEIGVFLAVCVCAVVPLAVLLVYLIGGLFLLLDSLSL
jgi:hypothetical protein